MNGRLRKVATDVGIVAGSPLLGLAIIAIFGNGMAVTGALPVIVGYGGIYGVVNALMAVGLVLVYRSARVINFAQAGFGAVAVTLYLILSVGKNWPWPLAFATTIAVSGLCGVVVEVFIVRRFARASRLVLTVALIGCSATMAGLSIFMHRLFGYDDPGTTQTDDPIPTGAPRTPFADITREWYPIVFNGNHIAVAVFAAVTMVGLGVFFRFSDVGVAVRGAAQNTIRAEFLGINVNNLSTVVWAIVGVLGGVSALSLAMVNDATMLTAGSVTGGGLVAMLRVLAAAVIARMEDIPRAAVSAVAISMFQQSVFWARGSTTFVDVVLLFVVIAALLARRGGMSRADADPASSWEANEEVRPIPAELSGLPEVRAFVRRCLWGLGIVVAAWPWVMSTEQTSLGGVYAIYGMIGVSLVVLTGWAGQISLGQFGFAGVGAAVAAACSGSLGLPFLVAVVAGTLAAGVAAVLVGLPALRIQGLFLAATTLAFAVAVSTWFVGLSWIPTAVDRPVVLFFDGNTDERTMYYVCVAGLGLVIWMAQGLRNSRTGRLLIAIRDNERTAQSYGLNLVRARLTAFAISGMMAGLAGSLFAFHQRSVEAASFIPEQSANLFMMAVIGGVGSVYSVLVGAVLFGSITLFVSVPGLLLIINSLGLLLVLVFFPQGLGSLMFALRDAYLRRVAYRRRIFSPTLMGDRIVEGEEPRVDIEPRLSELGPVERIYRLDSEIGTAGASQLTKLWRV